MLGIYGKDSDDDCYDCYEDYYDYDEDYHDYLTVNAGAVNCSPNGTNLQGETKLLYTTKLQGETKLLPWVEISGYCY